jgi:aminoglycoside 6'-N-acetyltransferase
MPEIKLRPAMPADASLLRHWDTKAHVQAARGEDSNIDWDAELARRSPYDEWVIAETAGRAIGIMQICDAAQEESHYWGEIERGYKAVDIWIGEEDDLSRGYGTAMMQLALRRCFADPDVKAVVIDPLANNTAAHRFYQRLGFRAIGRRMFDADDCLVFQLDRAQWQPKIS